MAKSAKPKKLTPINNWEKATGHKIKNPEAKKKKGKYDITVKTDLSPDQLLKLVLNTPIKTKKG